MITRRDFLATGLALGSLPLVGRAQAADPETAIFRHGVASGDPLSNRVVLWTRLTPPAAAPAVIDVGWMIARDARMSRVVGRGNARTSAARDFTVKVDAAALEPGATYYYRFSAFGKRSPVGRTRTLPLKQTERVRLGIASCANHPFGYFNVYGRLAARADLDAVLHLGDYIYEYANNNYGNRPAGDGRPFGRIPRPDRETVTLDDYRTRYAQYREDPDLQAAHRQHPFIVVWDDHEFANDAWSGGAGNHHPETGEGEWQQRRAAAAQAWREWMPVRESPGIDFRLYRRFSFGNLADLLMLDARIDGRDRQAAPAANVAAIEARSRQMLGQAQEDWLFGTLEDSVRARRPWQVLGQQVMFAPQAPAGKPAENTDSWDGYRAARGRVFGAAAGVGVQHLVVLTGDIHSSWAYDLAPDPFSKYDPATGRGAVGSEIVTPAVTSPGWFSPEQEPAMRKARPHLRFLEGQHRGYVIVDITRERMQADWWFVPTISERVDAQFCARSLVTSAREPHLVETPSPILPARAPDPAP